MSERPYESHAEFDPRAIDAVFDVAQRGDEPTDGFGDDLDALRSFREEVREALVHEPSRGEDAAAEEALPLLGGRIWRSSSPTRSHPFQAHSGQIRGPAGAKGGSLDAWKARRYLTDWSTGGVESPVLERR